MKKYALISAVQVYQPNSGISNLKYTERDAVALGGALQQVCDFDYVSVFAGNAKFSRGHATQNAILDELEDWARIMASEDLFLFAFFGHGMERRIDDVQRGYLLPADARLSRPNTLIEMGHLKTMYERIRASQRVILLDCCRNDPEAGRSDGDNFLTEEGFGRDVIEVARAAPRRTQAATALIRACQSGHRAYEWDRVKHGVLAYFLLQGICRHAWKDGRLAVNDVAAYVQDQIAQWSAGAARQVPAYEQYGMAQPILLADRPEQRRSSAGMVVEHLDDPERIAVREFSLEELTLDVSFDPILPRTEVPPANLPPIPEEIRKQQGEIAGMEKAIAELRTGRHPALNAAKQEVEKARSQYEQLQADLEAHDNGLPKEVRSQLIARFKRAPGNISLFDHEDLYPHDMAYTDFMAMVCRIRNTEKARKIHQDLCRELDRIQAQKIVEIKTRQKQAKHELEQAIVGFVESIIHEFLVEWKTDDFGDAFPGEAFIPVARSLSEYGFPLDDRRIWQIARDYYLFMTAQLIEDMQRRSAEASELSFRKFLDCGNGVQLEVVWIPPGEFLMGSPISEKGRGQDEHQHRIRLSQGFYMGVHPVTQAQYEALTGKIPSYFKGPDLPVQCVSWQDAVAFCRALGKKQRSKCRLRPSAAFGPHRGEDYRLPTEAQWEYACRAGTVTPFYFGETIDMDQVNYVHALSPEGSLGLVPQEGPTPIGRFPANAFGLHDMHGNVLEWCSDWYDAKYYAQSPTSDPEGPQKGASRVLRGGSWDLEPQLCRSAYRSQVSPHSRSYDTGFRIVAVFDD